jgi:sialate O-acetylesterase
MAVADVRLPSVFSSHMVLQRGLAAPVWGWGDPGEKVTVAFGGQKQTATVDEQGRWSLKLDPLDASSEGRTLEVTGNNKLAFENVLVGDVWICSGQSNMEWTVNATINATEEIASADFPAIRLFNVPGHPTAPLPQDNCGGNWQVCNPQTAPGFSAVGFYFGRHLHQETKTPIGLIGTNWGGTRIEPWTPPVGFRSVPELAALSEQVDRFDPSVAAGKATWTKYLASMEDWLAQTRQSLAAGRQPTPAPATPGFNDGGQPTAIYNAMVAPLAPYGIRGAIWYQGESNGNEGVEYFHKMQALINGWRSVWNQGEDSPLYFYFVQLANWQQPSDNPAGDDGWTRVRDAQTQSLSIPHTGMAVAIDIGQANDIHPRNKQDVGKRLALWALRDVYQQDVVVSGPLYRESKVDGDKIRISFDHADSGLIVGRKEGLAPTEADSAGKLARFAVAGKDKVWQWADAVIEGKTVVVSSDKVPNPVAVRYAWSKNPAGANLYNKEGLPAVPFRTDEW